MNRAFLLLFVLLVKCSFSQKQNNVCPTLRDYFNMKNNSKCWYNFAADDKVPDIIKKTGYPFIEYKVKTSDGYILKVFRIPNLGSKKPAIFMLHGVQGTSAIFVGLNRQSIAFLLYEAGYDVWLGNYRGTEYSEEHEFLNSTQREFWDYSADDIGLKDVPAMLELVNYHAGHRGKIIYIGHSLGTTASLMYSSEYPERAARILGLMVMMAPCHKLSHMRSPYRFLLPLLYPALDVTNALNIVQPISGGNIRNVTRPVCLSSPPMMTICLTLLNLFLGPFSKIAPETIPVYLNQIPAGTSLKTMTFLTEATRGRFRKFNYGAGKNIFLYGSEMPPEYDLKKIKVPVYIMFAANDWATTKEDSIRLYRELPQNIRYGIYEIRNWNFNHYDFLYGQDSKKLVSDVLIRVLDQFSLKQKSSRKIL